MKGVRTYCRYLSIVVVVASFGIPAAHAQFDLGKLKDALQKIQRKTDSLPGASSNQAPSQPNAQSRKGGAGFGAKATEAYCRNLFSVASISKNSAINESLVLEEFNIKPADFFDAVSGSVNASNGRTSYLFPSPGFYRGEFESDKVNVLYDLILSYPSPQYAAVLIAESRTVHSTPRYDHQAKVDAMAALAILHFRMQDKTNLPNRWRELVAAIQKEEHYTNYVFHARLLQSGEMGARNPSNAISYLYDANGLRGKYNSSHGMKAMSERNHGIASGLTHYEILVANPGLVKVGFNGQFMKSYEAGKNAATIAPELQAQLGPELDRIQKASDSASKKALEMLSGATEASRLAAEKVALDSAMRTRVSDSSDANVNTATMAEIARQLEKLTKLDENQKKMFASALADAHESGDRAIGMMPMLLSSMFNLLSQRGFGAMPAFTPYARKVQAYADNACTVISRWDNAAQVTATSVGEDSDSRSSLASLVNDTPK
jgi:hypothetical protein